MCCGSRMPGLKNRTGGLRMSVRALAQLALHRRPIERLLLTGSVARGRLLQGHLMPGRGIQPRLLATDRLPQLFHWSFDVHSDGRPCWTRTNDQRIMPATSAFAARFRFVVWTLSCLSAFPSSLYTFSTQELRSALARHCCPSVHRIWEVLLQGRVNLP